MQVLEIATPHGPARAHVDLPADAQVALVLTHGAGGGITAPDLAAVRDAAVGAGLAIARVEQPYRAAGRKAPPRAPQLDAAWIAVVDGLREGALAGLGLITGGRSMGARVACRTAAQTGAKAVVCLAFPLRPPRRTGDAPSRLPELDAVAVPVLIVQGAKDPFGMPPAGDGRTVVTIDGADHALRRGLPEIGAAVVAFASSYAA